VDQSSPIFLTQRGRVVVDKVLFRLAIYRSVPEIFVIEIETCQKSRRILDVFSPSQILGRRPSKSYTHLSPLLHATSPGKVSLDTPIIPEVLVAHTLNFKTNFKFLRLIFFLGGGEPRPSCGVR